MLPYRLCRSQSLFPALMVFLFDVRNSNLVCINITFNLANNRVRRMWRFISCKLAREIIAKPACKADRTEPYTRITPFQEKHDTSVECIVF